jgi:hypothetical protein
MFANPEAIHMSETSPLLRSGQLRRMKLNC